MGVDGRNSLDIQLQPHPQQKQKLLQAQTAAMIALLLLKKDVNNVPFERHWILKKRREGTQKDLGVVVGGLGPCQKNCVVLWVVCAVLAKVFGWQHRGLFAVW